MIRAALGQAGFDRRGLWIDDQDQGWALRVGEVSSEIYATGVHDNMSLDEFNQWNDDMQGTGPVMGFFFSKSF